jgi:hypothetical protein
LVSDIVRMTERLLKHIALQSCPSQHRVLVQDCATFARNFFTKLLRHLKDSVGDEELERQIKILVSHIHIEEGSIGASEDSARADPDLGESAYKSYASHQGREGPLGTELSARWLEACLRLLSSSAVMTFLQNLLNGWMGYWQVFHWKGACDCHTISENPQWVGKTQGRRKQSFE